MTLAALTEEPTQASIRAHLAELLAEVGPVPLQAPRPLFGRPEGLGRRLRAPSVAYLLPGLPPEGSGGSHSLVQEARGLRQLGARAKVCVPRDSLETAAAVYGNEDHLFVAYRSDSDAASTGATAPRVGDSAAAGVGDSSLLEAVADADVVVATEYPSVDLLARVARERPGTVCAYYVQDYEPLFAAPESSRADRALLSYRALPDLLLFAKTDWLCQLVSALHGVPVAKVAPSLDRELFHRGGRSCGTGAVRIAAMIRPRTPRRRPLATLEALAEIACELGEGVRITTFGCAADSFEELREAAISGEELGELAIPTETREPTIPALTHLGLLSRLQVSELMRRSDIFIDASAYQAFGRTGLEAMACGAVPLLPQLGGVHEYADAENAVILDEGTLREIADAAISLARDPMRLLELREGGLRTTQRFSIQRAARSQLELFAGAVAGVAR